MKKINVNIPVVLSLILFSCLTFSCREDEKIDPNLLIPDLGGRDYEKTAIDTFLMKKFLPYNINVLYRWDAALMQTSFTKPLVPIKEELVIPFATAIHDVWFAPYVQVAGLGFVRTYTPKEVVLVGSTEYVSGAIALGQAEGGRIIRLLNVNNFDPSNADNLKAFLCTIEHEFAHVLHETKSLDPKFANISAGKYNPSGWTNINAGTQSSKANEPNAYKLGFSSAYAASGKDDDFAETMSLIMVYGRDWFENTVIAGASVATAAPDAVSMLRQKEAAVVAYLKTSWQIDFYDNVSSGNKGLVTCVQEAIKNVVKNNNK